MTPTILLVLRYFLNANMIIIIIKQMQLIKRSAIYSYDNSRRYIHLDPTSGVSLDLRTLDLMKPSSNPMLRCLSNRASSSTNRCSSSLSCELSCSVQLCTNCLRALFAAWVDVSQRSRVGLQLIRSARVWHVKGLGQSWRLDAALW